MNSTVTMQNTSITPLFKQIVTGFVQDSASSLAPILDSIPEAITPRLTSSVMEACKKTNISTSPVLPSVMYINLSDLPQTPPASD